MLLEPSTPVTKVDFRRSGGCSRVRWAGDVLETVARRREPSGEVGSFHASIRHSYRERAPCWPMPLARVTEVRRFAILSMDSGPGPGSHYRIKVEWALNNGISSGSVGNGAQDDVYAALRALFTAHLSLASVTLVGTYPAGHREGCYAAYDGFRTAHAIGRVGWDAVGPKQSGPSCTGFMWHPRYSQFSLSERRSVMSSLIQG
jgi:hypothetical protein